MRLFKISVVFLGILSIFLLLPGCKKLVEVDPPITRVTSDNVFTNDATAAAVLTGIYSNMSSNAYRFVTGATSISVLAGLSSDELTLAGGINNQIATWVRFYTNNLSNQDQDPWSSFYAILIQINTAIEKLNQSVSLTPSVQKQLIGEAKFLRGFVYFYLVNLYGDVPLVLTADYRMNSTLSRTPKSNVYEQIIIDLQEAKNSLSDGYLGSNVQAATTDRIRPNKWAATALLARVYLYNKDWVNAETEASLIINNSSQYALQTLSNVFLKNSKEAIWQLQPVNSDRITDDARIFTIKAEPTGTGSYPVYLSSFLLNAFDPGDNRRTNWIKDTVFNGKPYSYPTKYKSASTVTSFTEYLMVLRLAEQYLIRAEARAMQNKFQPAIDDVNEIRLKHGGFSTPLAAPVSQPQAIDIIMHERQVELFTEWGHRWLDLKRTGKVDDVMKVVTPIKGGTWNSNWALYPIPLYDIQQDPNLVQNPGY